MTRQGSSVAIARSGSGGGWKGLASTGAIVALVAAVGVGVYATSGVRVDKATDCLAQGMPPAAAVLAVDTSDPLIVDQMGAVEGASQDLVDGMPAYGRLVLLEMRGDGIRLDPLLDRCVPRLTSNTARNRFASKVRTPLAKLLQDLRARPEQARSPVIESVLAIAAEKKWRDTDGRVSILLATDGLENTRSLSFYRPGDANPILGSPLKNVKVTIVPLRNPRDLARQSAAFERLSTLLRGAGAQVIYNRPAWLAFEEVR